LLLAKLINSKNAAPSEFGSCRGGSQLQIKFDSKIQVNLISGLVEK